MSGHLFVITAASGTGKTSLVREITSTDDNLKISISYTTRPPRPNDIEGVDYFFVDTAQFESMIAADDFLEYAHIYGNMYGTSIAWVKKELKEGHDVILEIDWQGALNVKKHFPDCVSIFILPPSIEILRERIVKRGQDDVDVIERRMQCAMEEISHYHEFDYLVVNDDFNKAASDLRSIMHSTRLKEQYVEEDYADLIGKLLRRRD